MQNSMSQFPIPPSGRLVLLALARWGAWVAGCVCTAAARRQRSPLILGFFIIRDALLAVTLGSRIFRGGEIRDRPRGLAIPGALPRAPTIKLNGHTYNRRCFEVHSDANGDFVHLRVKIPGLWSCQLTLGIPRCGGTSWV